MIYYTSDLHFGHKNIIRYENRPFLTVEDMTNGLINRWNSKVKQNDTVYVLGDFAFKNKDLTVDKINDIVKQLNGDKVLILGNHDLWINSIDFKSALWKEIAYYKEIKDTIKEDNKIVKKDIVLCHYPIESWNCQLYGTIHLHGHLHSHPTVLNQKNRYNVGCDNWDYYPVTLEEIINNKN